jgi:hypothetical protein
MKKGILLSSFMLLFLVLNASPIIKDSLIVVKRIHLLNLISELQIKENNTDLNGSFPSTRKYFYSHRLKDEDNVFYTSLILWNLGQFEKEMKQDELSIFKQAKSNALPYIERFINKKNNLTYNFWPRNPAQIFPNGGWLNLFNEKFSLADDIDDAAITWLALGLNDSIAHKLQSKFSDYSVGRIKPNRSFYKAYKNWPVYSTWLGHKMPKDVDISVLSNVLLMHTKANIPFNNNDSASFNLIVELVRTNKHLSDPKYVSQHYANSATIIYHIARLIYFSNYPALLSLKPILLSQAKQLLLQTNAPVEKLLLNTSILRLGEKIEFPGGVDEQTLKVNNYPYFVANIASVLNNPFKRIVNQSNIVRFDYYSYAFNLSLMYENLMLRP